MNARRRRGEQVIDEEDEEYRGDDRALGYTSIDRVQIGEEAIHSDGNRPIREETTNPINESVMENKRRQLSEKTFVPDAIKGLGESREITLLSPSIFGPIKHFYINTLICVFLKGTHFLDSKRQ